MILPGSCLEKTPHQKFDELIITQSSKAHKGHSFILSNVIRNSRRKVIKSWKNRMLQWAVQGSPELFCCLSLQIRLIWLLHTQTNTLKQTNTKNPTHLCSKVQLIAHTPNPAQVFFSLFFLKRTICFFLCGTATKLHRPWKQKQNYKQQVVGHW